MDQIVFGVIFLFCFATVYSIDLPYRTFRCRNGTFIDDQLICDGKIDCVQAGDGLDENLNFCDPKDCGPGKFLCAAVGVEDNPCKNGKSRCNTLKDCVMFEEEMDEKDCGDEIEVDNCTLNHGKYLCDDGLRCLNIQNTCDGICNCFDCSDEKIKCAIGDETFKSSNQACLKTPNGPFCCSDYDSLCQKCTSNKTCDHKCVKFANQEKCVCNETYEGVTGTDNSRCEISNNVGTRNDVADEYSHKICFNTSHGQQCCSKYDSTTCHECSLNDICDQKCVEFANQTRCFCEENYISVPGTNNTSCFPRYNAVKGKLLLYSSEHSIKAINLFTKQSFIIDESMGADCEPYYMAGTRNYVYYATVKSFGCSSVSIFRVSLENKNDTREIIVLDDDVTTLAVDWITNNLYYSANESLFVCNGDGEMCRKIKSGEIYNVNLAPRFGLMFWIHRIVGNYENSTCNLMKASMDGTGEKLLLSINGLCDTMWSVDESTERISWYDPTLEGILSVNFNGKNKMFTPFSLQLYSGVMEFRNTWHAPVDYPPLKLTRMGFGTMFENEIFFTDVNQQEIWSLEKDSQIFAKRYPLPKISESEDGLDLAQIKGIYVYNPNLQLSKIGNPCPANCKELCFPSSSGETLKHYCSGAKKISAISINALVGFGLTIWLLSHYLVLVKGA